MVIENILFDLGGVILNIDYEKTISAFKKLGLSNFDEIYSQFKQERLFDDIETGKISADDFTRRIKDLFSKDVNNVDIESAWNAMLLDLPGERLDLLKKSGKNYRIFLLSNTNQIHYNEYIKYIEKVHQVDFNGFIEKAYYSHEIGLRKPNQDCFDYVCSQNNLKAENTLFIDDSIQHIEGAKACGINAYHLQKPNTIQSLFDADGYLVLS